MRADEALLLLQWIGAKIEPCCWPALVTTLRTQEPCRLADAREAAIGEAEALGVERMHLDERLGLVRAERRALAGAGHGVPLVAQPAGVQSQREFVGGRLAAARAAPAQ